MKMKISLLIIITCLFFHIKMQSQSLKIEEIAQGQLVAYNNQDIEAFLSWYSNDVKVYNFPNELIYEGKNEMRVRYLKAWKLNPNQKAEVTKRISLENTVLDEEYVTGRSSGIGAHVVAIYKIERSKIKQVFFIRE